MKAILTLSMLAGMAAGAFAQNKYEYSVDLLNIKNDQVEVTLKTPQLKKTDVIFAFPKAIPGSYARKDFGRFINDLQAFDKDGKPVKVTKQGKNQFVIKNAAQLAVIKYKVSDTWDSKHDDFIFQPGGSNIEAGVNVVMNNHAFFGYFEDDAQLPFEITVSKPDDFYAATHLDVDRSAPGKDVIKAKNYVYLADNPVIYAKPDTTSFNIGKTKVNVSVYSATGKVKSAQVAEYLKPLAGGLDKFFNGLPVPSYQFLYYFEESGKGLTDRDKGEGGFGALEHNYSSLYYLPEIAFEKRLISMINEVSSHEFLHILTPLNLHSNEIENFNFSYPQMSQHLWLYEGVTEYFSNLVQLQNKTITEKEFFEEMRKKINSAEEFGNFSMTEMSKRVMEDAFQKKYSSVYSKGALIAFLLDIDIREKTNGQKDLRSVITSLTKKYGPSKPFDDNAFIAEFVAAAHPDVKVFMDKYIVGANPLPFAEYFNKLGYEYAPTKSIPVYYPGKTPLKYDEATKSIMFTDVEKNALGVKNGDVFKAIDGVEITEDNIDGIWDEYFGKNTQHPSIAIAIIRNGTHQVLKGKIYEGRLEMKNYVGQAEQSTTMQQQILSSIKGS
ncbi:peptidase M61 [Mucilaginibacter sp. JRF]|uniref:M61 family metallopeptidase n=1 Tax=Mucilaginibacter sp. JRF TaxID=2780088 RepID=UPI0018814252|nr:peptidase M61 [Mucilaginibacter sp. JRF]MBE9585023.1 peptidase M61 [Mucilaginibacter sp. JRF]